MTTPFDDYSASMFLNMDLMNEAMREEIKRLRGRIAELEAECDRFRSSIAEVEEWRQCAKYDPKMSGKMQFTGLDRSQFDRCRRRFIEGLGP